MATTAYSTLAVYARKQRDIKQRCQEQSDFNTFERVFNLIFFIFMLKKINA